MRMSRSSARITDAALRAMADRLVNEARIVAKELAKRTRYSAARVLDYALLVVVTAVPFGRALVYLKDCKTPESARGRLLMRAAERTFREMGDQNGPEYEDKD
jgi:hypothetical protein